MSSHCLTPSPVSKKRIELGISCLNIVQLNKHYKMLTSPPDIVDEMVSLRESGSESDSIL